MNVKTLALTMVLCTIIARNYLAHARVLCESFRKQHSDGSCYVLIVDDPAGHFDPAQESFEVVTLEQIPLPKRREIFCFQYNVTELATAVKPFFLRWLLESRSEPAALYLDPDILVTDSLIPLWERLTRADGGGLILTPHLEVDYPEDGLQPNDEHILTSGVFNLGFFGIRSGASARRFLPWLEKKLTDRCVVDHAAGLFVDQKFFDLAITLFPEIEVERDPGYNVAYWNLHSRELTRAEDRYEWRCNGSPLYFFHFSNYKPDRAESISGHQTRFQLKDRPDLQPLFAYYRSELLRNGYEQTRAWKYGYACFADGYGISDAVRREFRRRIDFWTQSQEDPFRSRRMARIARLIDVRVALYEAWERRKAQGRSHLGRMFRSWVGYSLPGRR